MATDVVEITITGPGRNALGTPVMERILEDLRAATGRAVLLTGAGETFSSGLNLKEVASLDRAGMERYLRLLDAVIDALWDHPAPLVAAVNGHAIAGGCILALCCDVRVVADDPKLRIGLNEVALGLVFPPKLMALVRRRVPPRGIERVVLEAGLYDPRTALQLGLVDEVATDVQAMARGRVEQLAAYPRDVYAATKWVLRAGALDLSAEDQRRFRDEVVPAWCSPAVKARVEATLGRRA
jgi:enoyl-CoA hydratase/carnithine racemase